MSSTRQKGEKALDEILKRVGDIPLSKITDLEGITYDNPKWESRPKSVIVKWLLNQSELSLDLLAQYLGCSKEYLNNKITRGSFSFDDLVVVAYACGYEFTLTKNTEDSSSRESYVIHCDQYLCAEDKGREPEKQAMPRIYQIEKKKNDEMKIEYERKKAELEKIKREYGFDD